MNRTIRSNRVSLKLRLLLCLAWLVVPAQSHAQTHSYPVNSRATFLTGCLLDNSPNFDSDREVTHVMETCVCMLDKFQDNYNNLEFLRLFARADNGEERYQEELEDFAESHIYECL